jgi:hypothetical protein
MATERRGGSGSGGGKGGQVPTTSPEGILGSRPALERAVKSFIETNANFENSAFQRKVLEEMRKAKTLDALYQEALKQRVFEFASAMGFFVLLGKAPELSEANGDPAGLPPLNLATALELTTVMYDRAYESVAADHFAEEGSDEEGSEEEGSEEEGSEGGGAEEEEDRGPEGAGWGLM